MRSPCERINRLLLPYVDGELPPALAECVGSHVAGCPRCTARVEELRRPISLLRSWPAADPRDLQDLAAQREELVATFARGVRVSTAGNRAPGGPWAIWSGAAAAGRAATRRLRTVTAAATRRGLVSATMAAGAMAWFLLTATKNAGHPSDSRDPAHRLPTALARAGRGALAVGGAVLRVAFRVGRSAVALG